MGLYATFGSDMPGSCTIAPHEDWMELLSFGHGIDRPYATGGKWDPANIHDFIMTKKMDKASPKLNQAILAGTCFDEVEVHFCTTVAGEEEKPVYTLKLEKVRVTSYNLNGVKEGESLETISIFADKVSWKYSVQNEEKEEGQVEYAYDVKARKAG
jgi:type VI secretion system secreted protein Hcp